VRVQLLYIYVDNKVALNRKQIALKHKSAECQLPPRNNFVLKMNDITQSFSVAVRGCGRNTGGVARGTRPVGIRNTDAAGMRICHAMVSSSPRVGRPICVH